MVDAFGGKCICCGYDKCNSALEFHHINPEEKDFSFGAAMASPKAWSSLVVELRKCVLLCSNCHREVHAGLKEIESKNYFNEEYAEYRIKVNMDSCPVCSKLKPINNRTCSLRCAGKLRSKINWEEVNLSELLVLYKNPEQVGKFLNVSGAAVRKQLKKT